MRIVEYIIKSVAIMAALFCLSQLTVLFRGYSADWPPLFVSQRGFTLALMVVSGFKYAIPFWLISIFLNKFYWNTNFILGLISPISLIISLELSAFIYRKLCGTKSPLHKMKDWLLFLFVVVPLRELFSFVSLRVFNWLFPLEGLLQNQEYWAMADILGLVMGFPLFLEILNSMDSKVIRPKLNRGLPALVIGNAVGILPFYLGIQKLSFLEGPGRYLSLFAMTAVGLFSSPLAMAFSILAHAFWVAWSREGMIKSLGLKGVDPHFDIQLYLLCLACFAPIIALIVKSQRGNELAETFEEIKEALDSAGVEQSVIKMENQSDSVGVALFDLQYRCLHMNEKFAEFSGGDMKSQLGKTSQDRLGPNAAHVAAVFEEVRKRAKPIWNYKLHFEAWNQVAERDLVCNYLPVFSQSGEVIAIIVISSENKKTKENLLKEAKGAFDIAHQNRLFSLAMSHDLQEPLRNISQSLKILNERFKRRADTETLSFLENALSATNRVRQMVQSSLELAQLENLKLQLISVEAEEIFEECKKSYAIDLERVKAKISIGPLPVIKVDKVLLGRVVSNLLSNTLKYKSERELHIMISAKTENGKHQFTFSDNGIGFDNKDAETIFTLYHRLFSSEEREGYGVGLTVSRRIIELHGGKMWAESFPGEGSSFYFTLPVD
jgi:signal transduction histidine kinase